MLMMYLKCCTKLRIFGPFAFLVGCVKGVASNLGTEQSNVPFSDIYAGVTPLEP